MLYFEQPPPRLDDRTAHRQYVKQIRYEAKVFLAWLGAIYAVGFIVALLVFSAVLK